MADEQVEEQQHPIECCFCKESVPNVEAAVFAGWIPSFIEDGDEVEGPVCPGCINEHLELDNFGEWVRATED